MSNNIESAIDEIERVLVGNKNPTVNTVYLENAVRFLKAEIDEPELTMNQITARNDLELDKCETVLDAILSIARMVNYDKQLSDTAYVDIISNAYLNMTNNEILQILNSLYGGKGES